MLRLVALTILIFAGAVSIARADVFRWVDEQGEVHYSDRWVPGSVLIKTNKPHPTVEADAPQRGSEPSKVAAAGQRASGQLAQQATAQAVKQDVAKAREQQCKQAKERYEQAIQARHISKPTKDGEREYLSDAEANAYRVQAREAVKELCGSSPQ